MIEENERISRGIKNDNFRRRLTVDFENNITGGISEPDLSTCKARMFLGNEQINGDRRNGRLYGI